MPPRVGIGPETGAASEWVTVDGWDDPSGPNSLAVAWPEDEVDDALPDGVDDALLDGVDGGADASGADSLAVA